LEILDCVEGKRKFEEILIDLLFSSLDQATKDLEESKWRYMGSIAISLKEESLEPEDIAECVCRSFDAQRPHVDRNQELKF
jgi:hypothetical protein